MRVLKLARRRPGGIMIKFWKIAENFKRNFRKIEKKIVNDSWKIMETLLGKTEWIRIILMKWGKNYEEIFEKFRKNIINPSQKI